jgi:VanZ family protein
LHARSFLTIFALCRAALAAPSGPDRLMRLRTWGLTVAWAVVIVAVTAAPASTLPSAPILPGIDKLVHAGLFGILSWLALQARDRDRGVHLPSWMLVSGLALFAAADEWLQRLVPGRTASIMDWMADIVGILIAVWLFAVAPARRETVS